MQCYLFKEGVPALSKSSTTLQLVLNGRTRFTFGASNSDQVVLEVLDAFRILPQGGRYHFAFVVLDPDHLNSSESLCLVILVVAGVPQEEVL